MPWYADGLQFECTQCGACCSGEPGHVWLTPSELDALARRLGMSSEEFERQFVYDVGVRRSLIERENGDCIFLDEVSRTCTVYEDRPRQCKTWPFWRSNLKSPRSWKKTCEVCPGAGRGRTASLVEIQASLEGIDV